LVAIAVALAIATGAAAAPAAASPDDRTAARARAMHDRGLRAYEAGDYAAAVRAYTEAYTLVPAPGILFNLAQAHRLAGDCRRALQAYKSFLRTAPDSPQAPVAEAKIEEMERCVADDTAARDRGGATTTTSAVPLVPVRGAAGDGAGDTDDRGGSPGRGKRWIGLSLVAVGAGLATVGVVSGFQARSAANDLEEFYDRGGEWTPELAATEERRDSAQARAIGFSIAGAAAFGVGGVLYWMGRSDAEAASRSGLVIAPARDGAFIGWAGQL
jgi:tetratricopeptide (TPR) repeat protein